MQTSNATGANALFLENQLPILQHWHAVLPHYDPIPQEIEEQPFPIIGGMIQAQDGVGAPPELIRLDPIGVPTVASQTMIGAAIGGSAITGPALTGPTIIGPAIAGSAITGPAAAGPTIIGPAIAGSAVIPGPAAAGPTVIPGPAAAGPTVIPGPAVAGPTVIPGPAVAGPTVIPGPAITGEMVTGPPGTGLGATGARPAATGATGQQPAPSVAFPVVYGTYQEMIRGIIGRYVVAEFLIGTVNIERRIGMVTDVGPGFLVLKSPCIDTYIACDLYSLKFLTVLPLTESIEQALCTLQILSLT